MSLNCNCPNIFSGSVVSLPPLEPCSRHLSITSLQPHHTSLTPIHPNFKCGDKRVVLGSRDVGAVCGFEKVATSVGFDRNDERHSCAEVVPPRMDVVGSP